MHLSKLIFVIVLTRLGTFCITLHQAEQLRDMPDNILPIIVNLDALVREYMRLHYPNTRAPNIVTLLLTSCIWDKFYSGTFSSEPACLYLKAYTRDELTKILISAAPVESPRYGRFINILLTVCLPVTRNIKELLFLAQVSIHDDILKYVNIITHCIAENLKSLLSMRNLLIRIIH